MAGGTYADWWDRTEQEHEVTAPVVQTFMEPWT